MTRLSRSKLTLFFASVGTWRFANWNVSHAQKKQGKYKRNLFWHPLRLHPLRGIWYCGVIQSVLSGKQVEYPVIYSWWSINIYMALAKHGLVPSIVHTWNPWHFNFQQLLMLPLLGPGDQKRQPKASSLSEPLLSCSNWMVRPYSFPLGSCCSL